MTGSDSNAHGIPASAMLLLRQVGIAVAQLEATDWNPDEKDMSRSRASQVEAMRNAHRAVAHTVEILRIKHAAQQTP